MDDQVSVISKGDKEVFLANPICRYVPTIENLRNSDPLTMLNEVIGSWNHIETINTKTQQDVKEFELRLALLLAVFEDKYGLKGKKWWNLKSFSYDLSSLITDRKRRSEIIRLGRLLLYFIDDYSLIESRFKISQIREFIRKNDIPLDVIGFIIQNERNSPVEDRPSQLTVKMLECVIKDLCTNFQEKTNNHLDTSDALVPNEMIKDFNKFVNNNTKIDQASENGIDFNLEKALDFQYGLSIITERCVEVQYQQYCKEVKVDPLITNIPLDHLPKLLYFPVFVDIDSMIVHQSISASKTCGLLASYGNFNKSNNIDRALLRDMMIMADCGAFQARTNPSFWNRNTPRDINHFYNDIKADFVIEPDVIHDDVKHSLVHGLQKAKEFRKHFSSNAVLIRPIHGGNADEKIEYVQIFDRIMGSRPTYYALGGLSSAGKNQFSDNDFENTITALLRYGVTRLHFLGMTSSETVNSILQYSDHFETLSFDSSSHFQKGVKAKVAIFFNEDNGKLEEISFSRNNDVKTIEKNAQRLSSCSCGICSQIHFKNEGDKLFSLGEMGHRMFLGESFFENIFNLKCSLHNAYQMSQFFEWKARTLH